MTKLPPRRMKIIKYGKKKLGCHLSRNNQIINEIDLNCVCKLMLHHLHRNTICGRATMEGAPSLCHPPLAHIRLWQELDAGAHAARWVGRADGVAAAPATGADCKRRRASRPLPRLCDQRAVGHDGRRTARPRGHRVQDAAGKHNRVHPPGQPHHDDVTLAAFCPHS